MRLSEAFAAHAQCAARPGTRLRAFIAEHDPHTAERVSERLRATLQHLTDHPELGVPLEALPEVRELSAGDYIARYTVTEEVVIVLRIWLGKEAR